MKDLKTSKSARDIPLSPVARDAVERWLRASRPDDIMFPGPKGGHWKYRSFLVAWAALARAAGLAGWQPYELRHTGASLLLAEGLSIVAVAQRMGHTSPTMILRVYGHALPDDQGRLTAAFGAIYAAAPAATRPDGRGDNVGISSGGVV